jgi:hypothetical protein
LSQWAANPIAWSKVDIAAAIPIILGIMLQGKAFRSTFDGEPFRPQL